MAKSLIGNLAVNLLLETAAFEEGANYAEKRLNKAAKRFEQIGANMVDRGTKLSIGLTAPIVALAGASIKAAQESQEAIGQVEAALKSMGGGAGRSIEQLQGLASGIMRKSLYDDDEILRKVTANLLTFGTVAGENFDRAQQAAVDLAARTGSDLQSATLMVGKALNDPAKGLSALRRVGIQFTEQQKEQIETMVEAGDAAGAQAIMISELERQFGGSAAAMRAADPAAALKMSWAKFQEEIGAKLLPLLPPLADAIIRVLDAFGSLSPEMQKTLLIAAGIAAALGPVLVVFGSLVQVASPLIGAFSLISSSLGAAGGVAAALGALAGAASVVLPIIAAVAAAGYLIYQNWDKISAVLSQVWETIQETLGPPLQELVTAVSGLFTELWDGPLGEGIRAVINTLLSLAATHAKVFGPVVLAILKSFIQALTSVFTFIGDGVRMVSALFNGEWQTAFRLAFSMVDRIFGGLPSAIARILGNIISEIRKWIGKLGEVFAPVQQKVDQVKGWFYGLYDAVVGHSYIPDMVEGIAAQMLRLDTVMVDKAKETTEKTKASFKKMSDDVKALMDRLFPEASALNQFRADRATIDKGEKSGMLSAEQAAEARRRLNREGTDSTIEDRVDDWNVPITEGMTDFVEQMEKMGKKAKEQTELTSQTFADMARDVLGSLQGLANSIKSGNFLDIFSSIFDLVLQLGSVGVFGKGFQNTLATNVKSATNFGGFRAMGGPVVSGKSYVVGENGPEWFTPGTSGRIHPMNDNNGARVTIVPSPYFDAHVDGRAVKVAAPMAVAAGNFARQTTPNDIAQRDRRRIPG